MIRINPHLKKERKKNSLPKMLTFFAVVVMLSLCAVSLADTEQRGSYSDASSTILPVTPISPTGGQIGIGSVSDLEKVGKSASYPLDGDYVQTADITFGANDYFTPIGYGFGTFTGKFNGNGYTINGMKIDSSTYNVGMFSVAENATFENIALEGGWIVGTSNTGGIVGNAPNGITIKNCYNTNNVTGSGSVSNTGGIAGTVGNGTIIENCYSTGDVDGANCVGGVVGYTGSSTSIESCYSAGSVSGTSSVGGIVGFMGYSAFIENCYSAGGVSGDGDQIGGIVGYSEGNIIIEDCYNTGEINGARSGVGGIVGNGANVTAVNCFNTGRVKGSTGSYNVGGLIGYANSATIWNCYNVDDVIGNGRVGGIIGHSNSSGTTVRDCYNTGDVIASNSDVGGIVGNTNGVNLQNCYNTGDVSTSGSDVNNIGGLAGYTGNSASSIKNSYNTGDVSTSGNNVNNIGGMVGSTGGYANSFENCYNTGDINGSGSNIGGMVGNGYGPMTNCYNIGSVTGDGNNIGGIVGNLANTSTIGNCYNIGDIDAAGYNVGGMIGSANNATTTNCYNRGSVSGSSNIGGLVGSGNATITNCYNTGVIEENGNVGGIIGNVTGGSITNSYYLEDCISVSDARARTAVQLRSAPSAETYVAWNFYAIWSFFGSEYYNDGYPILLNIGYVGINITMQPSDMTVTNGDNAVFEVRAVSDESIVYVWEYYDPSTGWTEVSEGRGMDSNMLMISSMDYGNGTSLRCVLSNCTTYVASDTARLLLTDPVPVAGIHYINDETDLRNVGTGITGNDGFPWNLEDYYVQTANITMSSNLFTPIGSHSSPFTGTYDGNGHYIKNMTIDTTDVAGMFSAISDGAVMNLGLVNPSIRSDGDIGGIVGWTTDTVLIANCYVEGGTISYVTGGGAVGSIIGAVQAGSIATVTNCYNTGDVTGTDYVGGIVGYTDGTTTVTNCYNTGDVTGTDYVGGIVGVSGHVTIIINCYNTGDVSGNSAGGIVGHLGNSSTVTVNNSYYLAASAIGTYGEFKSSVQLQDQSTFVNWNFINVWGMNAGINSGYPILRALAPSIHTQPADILTGVGDTAVLSVKVTDNGSVPTYQWQIKNAGGWDNIPSSNTSSLTVDTGTADVNVYRVIVTCGDHTLTSMEATVTVVSEVYTVTTSVEFVDHGGTPVSQAFGYIEPFRAVFETSQIFTITPVNGYLMMDLTLNGEPVDYTVQYDNSGNVEMYFATITEQSGELKARFSYVLELTMTASPTGELEYKIGFGPWKRYDVPVKFAQGSEIYASVFPGNLTFQRWYSEDLGLSTNNPAVRLHDAADTDISAQAYFVPNDTPVLTALFTPSAYGTIEYLFDGDTIPGILYNNSLRVKSTDIVSIYAVTDIGVSDLVFMRWDKDQLPTSEPNPFVIDGLDNDTTIDAKHGYAITATSEGSGTITPSGTIVVEYGSPAPLFAITSNGGGIRDVVVNGQSVGAVKEYDIGDVYSPQTIHAIFSAGNTDYTVNITGDNGTSPDPVGKVKAGYGSSLTIYLNIKPGYRISDVIVDGESRPDLVMGDSLTLRDIKSNRTVDIRTTNVGTLFLDVDISGSGIVEYSIDGGDLVQYTGRVQMNRGSDVTLKATPSQGQDFAGWTGTRSSDNESVSISDAQSNISMKASFSEHSDPSDDLWLYAVIVIVIVLILVAVAVMIGRSKT
jgi:The GLUG motif.